MKNQVAVKETTHMTVSDQPPSEEILKSDVVIPKILLMQGLSEFVADGKAKMGEMVRSTTGEKLGDAQTPLELIPLTFKSTWIIQEKVKEKYEFRGIQGRNAANENEPWEFTEDGTQWRRVKSIDVFGLLPADVSAEYAEIKKYKETGAIPDMNKTLLPVVISFRSTSYNAGKAVVTHFTKAQGMARFGVKPYGFTLNLSCSKESNDKGTYFVWDVKQGSQVDKETFTRAEEWAHIVASKPLQVDEASETKAQEKSGPSQF